MKRVITALEPQVAEVPLRLSAIEEVGLAIGQPQSGPIMRAIATRSQGAGLTSVPVYAHQGDVPLMDLSFLRFSGEPCQVGAWEPKAAQQGVDGPLLKPCFQLSPGPAGFEVELMSFMPRA